MDSLVRYIHKKPGLITGIIDSGNLDLIKSVYLMSLHHGIPLKSFFLHSLSQEFHEKSLKTIFREDSYTGPLLIDYFSKHGGQFNLLVNQIKDWSVEHKAGKSSRNLNKVVHKIILQMDTVLGSIMSNDLIDFCGLICTHANNLKPGSGEDLVSSFIFFRILNPKIIKNITEHESKHVLPVSKLLNKISSGDHDNANGSSRFIKKHIILFRQIIARAIMGRQESQYLSLEKMSRHKYCKYKNTLLRELEIYQQNELTHRKIRKTQTQFRLGSPKTQLVNHSDPPEPALSLEYLIGHAKETVDLKKENYDMRYLALWGNEELLKFLSPENLDLNFFVKWGTTGYEFLQLDRESLEFMNYEEDMNNVLNIIQECKDISIINSKQLLKVPLEKWSNLEICLWLTLSGLSNYVSVFTKLEIVGLDLLTFESQELQKIGVTNPDDIKKFFALLESS